ncbi:MAG: polyribonucleotide nucleotidyltransferase [Alphaproteobacteria bacterium]|jgi:polyribonucleotide nucleotidyltransferase|nr:polyribonucleotide nucleotidyltransferase [Alphaproteobacteria bacterium]
MFKITRREVEWAGRPLLLETGHVARQADGAVLATYGETAVLATVVGVKEVNPTQDFFPLTVHYQERTFAAGKIPGGFFKREGRPTEKETLTSRLIDRPLRPLFHPRFKNETQVICTVLSYDQENDPDIVAMVAASGALTVSGIPFLGPIGGARVGRVGGELVLNPTMQQMAESELDLVVAGTADAVMMVESEAQELGEDAMLEAVMFGHRGFQPVIDAIISLAEVAAKTPWDVPEVDHGDLPERVRALVADDLKAAYREPEKAARHDKIAAAKAKAHAELDGDDGARARPVSDLLKGVESDIVRGEILETGNRIDGRDTKTVRPILSEVGVLPRVHGSAIFTRGETQAFVVATLGTGQDEQMIDALEGEYRERFLLHYNFPPYSVGETGRVGNPGRREVGHGKLAWRATRPLLPAKEEFPYTIRVVSEITESNGSSSMATVCGTSLALMDAGVPMPRPVAGIAMGLIKEDDRFAVLSDILGDEDHLGDMDFKVAGTTEGVTSLQMDIKIAGITEEIMRVALDQARAGRLHILEEMGRALVEARPELRDTVPRVTTIKIPQDKIGAVIGPGGKVIREITETTGTKIDIGEDGVVKVAATDGEASKRAIAWIEGLTATPEVGRIYEGTVARVVDFGAFVNFLGPHDGLCHISELSDERVGKVTDVLNEGDRVKVKVLAIDDRGKVKLSRRAVDQETGEELEVKPKGAAAGDGETDGGGRRRRRAG